MKAKSHVLLSLLGIFLCIALSVLKHSSEHPKVVWDTSPDNVVISYGYFGEIDIGYIPDFRVWGDGYIVWVEHSSGSERKVYEGYLPQAELKELLEKFVDAGFYNWFGNDNSSYAYVGINLIKIYKQDSIDSNEQILELVNHVGTGAGVEAKEFKPTLGYLYTIPIEKTEYFNYKVTPHQWPQEMFTIDFENYDDAYPDGKEIAGDELTYVWSIVNNSPFIESNGRIFWIAVEIPKITY